MELGKRLKMAREAKGWTQAELGQLLNVSDATINRYERGQRRPDPNTLRRLAEALDVSLDHLVGLKDELKEAPSDYNPETEAAHRKDDPMSELPEEARKSLEDFKEFILKKYGKERK